MQHNVLIYPDRNLRYLFQDLIPKLNTQYSFNFKLLEINEELEQITKQSTIDFVSYKNTLTAFKLKSGYQETDLLILFTYAELSDSEYHVKSLFLTGRSLSEQGKCNSIVSLDNVNWDLFTEYYNYEIQKDALLHLLMCSLIATYCEINPHIETNGCLMDINLKLIEFKEKLKKGYYLCHEKGCMTKVSENKYGHAILQLCHTFKYSTLSNVYLNIPINDIRAEIISAKIDSDESFQNLILKVYEYAVKKPIEEWGFFDFLWKGDKPVGETQAQIALNALFKIILEIRAVNIGKEVETAGGFIDFLATHNYGNLLFKVGIEIKNAHNNSLEVGYAQLKKYLDSERTKFGVLIILWYKNKDFIMPTSYNTISDMEKELEAIDNSSYTIKTLVIDCTKKIVPSKAK